MKQHAQSTLNALSLTAGLNNEFGFTKARLARELVLICRKVNKHCKELVAKRLLEAKKWSVIYLSCNHEGIKSVRDHKWCN